MATHAHTTPEPGHPSDHRPPTRITDRRQALAPETPAGIVRTRRAALAFVMQGMVITTIPSAMAKGVGSTDTLRGGTMTASPFAPVLHATYPAQPVPDWQAAQLEARRLTAAAGEARAALEARIGPRGLTVGTLTLPGGRTAPIHLSDPEAARRFWRRLPRELSMDRPARVATVEAVQAACARWDAEAERAGVSEKERRATSARDRAKALMGRNVRAMFSSTEIG